MVCKVDDLEITQEADGTLQVTGILSGPSALLPRYAGRSGRAALRTWRHLGVQQADRDVPGRLDLALVAEVGSAVQLKVGRDGVLVRQTFPAPDLDCHRVANLMGMDVFFEGNREGQVIDVRLRAGATDMPLLCESLVVGRNLPGVHLGYDRLGVQGPRWLAAAVRWLLRHSGQAWFDDVAEIDWRRGLVVLSAPLRELTAVTGSPSG